jgi:succinate dehydrogenase hydrophobic anchor subunit
MKDSTRWMLHILAGLALVFLLGMHMGVMHMGGLMGLLYQPPAGTDAVDWAAVAERGRDTATFVLYILFLLLALYHGLYGLWSILIEALARHKIEKTLGWLLTLAGAGLFAYGAYTTYIAFLGQTM